MIIPQGLSFQPSAPTILHDSSTNVLERTYYFSAPVITGSEDDSHCRIDGLQQFSLPGLPVLPIQDVRILLPMNTELDSITIISDPPQTLPGSYCIAQGQQPVPLDTIHYFKPAPKNTAIYASSQPYPGVLYKGVGVQTFRGYHILIIDLFPVQYQPALGNILYYPSLTVRVETKPVSQDATMLRSSALDTKEVQSKVDNPNIIASYQDTTLTRQQKSSSLLIITSEELKNEFQPLAAAHTENGLPTMIRTLEHDIPPGSTYNDTCEHIRDYLRTMYQNDGIDYVLIGGDIELVPAAMLYAEANDTYPAGDAFYQTTMPSDIYYACLDGPFNADGDERWGEPHDGENGEDVDLLADVYVGRACVGNITEARNFVNKTLAYMVRDAHDEYLREALMLGEWMGGPPAYPTTFSDDCMEELITGSTEFGTTGIPHDEYSLYNFTRLYDSTWPGFDPEHPYSERWEADDLIPLINRGVQFIHHMGHSGPFYNMRLCLTQYQNDLVNLNNTKYCFVYSQGCDAGAFDRNASSNPQHPIPDCIAEHLTVKSPYGAFAGIWNARYGWYLPNDTDGPSQRYHREFVDALYGENISVLSQANQDSKEDNLYRIDEECMRWCYYELNFFGDPALEHHQLNPLHNIGAVGFTSPSHLQAHALVPISSCIVNSGTCDETNVWVSLKLNETIIGTQCIPSFEHHSIKDVSFNLLTPSAGRYVLTVNAYLQNIKEEFFSDNMKQQGIMVGVLNNNTGRLYNTIQQALIDTHTLQGHSIFIPQGTYYENIVITKNLTIQGENRDHTILVGKQRPTEASIIGSPTVLFSHVSASTLSNITITRKNDASPSNRKSYGIVLLASSNVTIKDTCVMGNEYGIYGMKQSINNHIFHNNFLKNLQHAIDQGMNVWDNGYPSGGNYWDDYKGVDGNHDGIGDIPYFFKEGVDQYPLMNPLL